MTVVIAGHSFATETDGERCQGESCDGVSSLVELLALDGIVQPGDQRVAHSGGLSPAEVQQIHEAAERMKERRAMLWG